MKKLSVKGQRWLKCFHITSVSLIVGGGACVSLKQFFIKPSDDLELCGMISTMMFIGNFIIAPGVIGALLTALIYSIWTNWGWFKHKWITVKWAINLFAFIFGMFWFSPWMNEIFRISKEKGLAALSDPTFLHNKSMLCIFGTFQFATLIFAVFIGVLKPGRKKKREE
jgi:MFS family permease